MNNEVEIDFLEPSLAIIISNLELIEIETAHLSLENKSLVALIEAFNDLATIEGLPELIDKLNKHYEQILTLVKSLSIEGKYELVSSLQIAVAAANFVSSDQFLFTSINDIEQLILTNQLDNDEASIFEHYKTLIIAKINQIYTEALLIFNQIYHENDEFIKVLKIAAQETNINDLREASKLLTNLFKITKPLANEHQTNNFKILNQAEALINLIDIWGQFELEDE